MTTTNYAFTGNESNSVTYTPTFDSAAHTLKMHWNLAAQRWYFSIYSNSGDRVLTAPLVASDDTTPINLLFGIFTSTTMIWNKVAGYIEVTY